MLYVKDVMSSKVRTAKVGESLLDCAKAMAKRGIGCLVVTDGTKPVGMVTEGDVSRAVARGADPSKTKVRPIKRLVTVGPAARVEEAAKLMASAGVKKLPVVEEGKLVGIITQTDIVGSSFDLVTSLKEMVLARYRPPDFEP